MIKLDDNLLTELGLGSLPKEEKTAFLKHMYETLEMRVGTRLAERMSDQQMAEFEQFINTNDEQGAFKWLEANFPNYKEVVADEFEKLKGEVGPLAQQIVSAGQQTDPQASFAPASSMPARQPGQPMIPAQRAAPEPLYPAPAGPAPMSAPAAPAFASPAQGGFAAAPSYQQPAGPQSFAPPAFGGPNPVPGPAPVSDQGFPMQPQQPMQPNPYAVPPQFAPGPPPPQSSSAIPAPPYGQPYQQNPYPPQQ